MSLLQHGLSKDFTWEKSKPLNRKYIKGFIAGLWVMVLTVAATTNQTWNHSLLWSVTCCPYHSKFKTHYHELPPGLHLHSTLSPQQPAQLKMKIKNPNTIYLHPCNGNIQWTGKTQWEPVIKEANTWGSLPMLEMWENVLRDGFQVTAYAKSYCSNPKITSSFHFCAENLLQTQRKCTREKDGAKKQTGVGKGVILSCDSRHGEELLPAQAALAEQHRPKPHAQLSLFW